MKSRILIVEDESIEAMGIELSLNSFGYQVVGIAYTGKEALQKVAELKPDLILMDIVLKGKIDGIEVASIIKDDYDIPVIYLTAHPENSAVERAKLTSPYGYIIKPYNKTELKNVIDLALAKHETEMQLKKTNQNLNRAQQVAKIGSWENQLATNDLRWSEEMYKILGFPAHSSVNLAEVIKIFPPEELKHFQHAVDAAINEDAPYSRDYRIIRPDGQARYIHDEGEIVRDENGQPLSMFGTTQDITERKKAELALSESEENFRAIAENANDGILIAVEEGNHVYVNPRAADITGYSEEELLHTSIGDLAHPHEFDMLMGRYRERISGKCVPPTYETRIVRKDNTVVPIEITAAKTVWNDKPAVLVIVRDVTEHRKIESSLKESEEKYRRLFDNAQDMISLIELDENGPGKFIEVNEIGIERLGYTREEFSTMTIQDIIVAHRRAEMPVNSENIKIDGHAKFEISHVSKSGREIPVEVNVHEFELNGKKVGLAVSRDITERKRAEDEIKKSLAQKEMLLKEIHHRVKNNLQIISSLLDLQERYVKEDPIAVSVLQESQNRVLSMAMVHEMLYQSDDLNHINFSSYIKNLISQLFHSYGVNSHVIPMITVEQVFLNIETAIPLGLIINEIVSNSLKYAFPSGEHGIISIDLHASDEGYQLRISDNGVGTGEDLNLEGKKALGLRLVDNLVKQIDGTIDYGDHEGTSFKIKFQELEYGNRV